MRVLVLCTHNSARSQMAEGWLKKIAKDFDYKLEVLSAGTVATFVKPEAIDAMNEIGIDISTHVSKVLFDLPDPWNFDYVITVCDSAAEVCPVYLAKTKRLHYPFIDPSAKGEKSWRVVRDQIGLKMTDFIVALLAESEIPESYSAAPSIEA